MKSNLDNQSVWLPYTQMHLNPTQLEAVSAQDVRIKLKDGSELIDGISSWWSVAHGYNHPKIINAIKEQADKLPHIMLAGFSNQQSYELADNLKRVTPDGLNKVFFSDSGSVGVEVAMKIAVQFFINQQKYNKNKFVSFINSYHGDTMGAMSLADLSTGMHKKFSNYLPKNYNIALPTNAEELNQFDDFLKKEKDNLAAIIVEPLAQCAGGMKFYSSKILRDIYQITKKHKLLFIADECATGFYRTGKYFACNHADITPDIMIVSKALTGGAVTLAATITTDEIYEQFLSDSLDHALMHGPTFMGNPLACAAANASIELFDEIDYEQKVAKIENVMTTQLAKCQNLPQVKDVRVLGAIGVVQTDQSWEEMFKMRAEFIKRGIWLKPFAGVIYIMPPLIIEEADLTKITDVIYEVLQQVL